MIRPQTPPISLHLFAVALIRFLSNGGSHCVLCLNAISRRTVNICHLRIYILCYYPLGLGLLAAKPQAAGFGRHALSGEGGSREGEDQVVITVLRVSSGCPI